MKTKLSILAELDPQSVWKEIVRFFDEQNDKIFDLTIQTTSLKIQIEELKARMK